jgi:hypothetical protein
LAERAGAVVPCVEARPERSRLWDLVVHFTEPCGQGYGLIGLTLVIWAGAVITWKTRRPEGRWARTAEAGS